MANGANHLALREKPDNGRLQPRGFEIGPHALGVAAGQEQRVEIALSDVVVDDRTLKFRALRHLIISAAANVIGLQQAREDAKPLAGHHFRIGVSRPAVRRGEDDAMPTVAQHAPRHAGLRRIEVVLGQGHQ